MPHLCGFYYPGICLTTGEKARKTLSQGSRRVPGGTKKIHKHKSVPLKAWSGPEGSRKLRFPYFMTTAQEGGKAPAAFTPRKFSWYSFMLEAVSTPGSWCDRKDYVNEKFQ